MVASLQCYLWWQVYRTSGLLLAASLQNKCCTCGAKYQEVYMFVVAGILKSIEETQYCDLEASPLKSRCVIGVQVQVNHLTPKAISSTSCQVLGSLTCSVV